ncbi:SPOR domain-containing protein [Litchfieldella rifensis]|uniref:SPOR domain-containing protein n=1 Tax=Litchfieldella rifensis TaxID=762643 RepID=A0ABV7LQ00_9GAMM
MKYGMRERLSGAVIIIALAVIFVPMLFDEPAPREERPEPVLTIEQPIDVERVPVPDPEPPSTLGNIREPQPLGEPEARDDIRNNRAKEEQSEEEPAQVVQVPPVEPKPSSDASAPAEVKPKPADPIAELARAAEERSDAAESTTPASPAGEWAVQAGSFGKPGNAERLEAQLNEQGFSAYRREREGGLTSVYVGPYDSSEAGERARTELKERANIQGLLVRVRAAE